jgi:alcohol dehydrogenase
VEAFIGQWATDYTDRMALAAVGLVFANLRTAHKEGRNLEARERMALAATYAGLAFTRANVGYVHAIAHQLGGRYHVPHGLANAILLPHVLRFLAPVVTKRLARLAVAAGVGKGVERPPVLAKRFIESVDKLNRDLRIPRTVVALKEADIPALARAACREADTNYPVPKYMSAEDCEGVIRHVLDKGGRKPASGERRRAR